MKRKRYKYSFAANREAKGGVASLVYGGLSLAFFLISAIVSFARRGDVSLIMGAVGFAALLLALAGFVLGLASFSEKNRNHRGSMVGSLVNGLLAVAWIGIYLVGI